MRRFTSMAHGAPDWMTRRSDERSYAARSSSGTSRMQIRCAGVRNTVVMRWRSTADRNVRASHERKATTVPPSQVVM